MTIATQQFWHIPLNNVCDAYNAFTSCNNANSFCFVVLAGTSELLQSHDKKLDVYELNNDWPISFPHCFLQLKIVRFSSSIPIKCHGVRFRPPVLAPLRAILWALLLDQMARSMYSVGIHFPVSVSITHSALVSITSLS